jgi:hypothetical protein
MKAMYGSMLGCRGDIDRIDRWPTCRGVSQPGQQALGIFYEMIAG